MPSVAWARNLQPLALAGTSDRAGSVEHAGARRAKAGHRPGTNQQETGRRGDGPDCLVNSL